MRCKLDFNEEMPLYSQKVKAWGITQSLEEEPCYSESDIKNDENRHFLEGYKAAIDDLCTALDSLTESIDISNESAETVIQWMRGKVCMVLFGILDDEMVEHESEEVND